MWIKIRPHTPLAFGMDRAVATSADSQCRACPLLSSAIFIVKGPRGVCRLAHSAIRGSWGKTHQFFLRSGAGARILRGVLLQEQITDGVPCVLRLGRCVFCSGRPAIGIVCLLDGHRPHHNGEASSHAHDGDLTPFAAGADGLELAGRLRVFAHPTPGRLHQQAPQDRRAPVGDVALPPPLRTRPLTAGETDMTGQRFGGCGRLRFGLKRRSGG